jgi:acyl-phosphate glycerol 3-phosphate acyltransferase
MEFLITLGYTLAAASAAYLIGSLSFAVLVSRVMGLADPRSYGSQNPGATNVLRSGNKAAAALTLLLDAVKGWLPVWALGRYGSAWGLAEGTLAVVALAAFAADCAWLLPYFCRVYYPPPVGTCVAHNTARVLLLAVVCPLAVIYVMESHFRKLFTLRYT